MNNTKIIAIANHKGGCGKTATTVHLAAELAEKGLKVLVVDLDPQCNASTHIGKVHPSQQPVTIRDLLLDGNPARLLEALQEDTNIHGVSLISSSLSLTTDEDRIKETDPRPHEVLGRILAPLDGLVDVIIIDTPPSLRTLTGNALACATHYIIPVFSGSQYGMYGVSDLQQFISKIRIINPNLEMLGVLLVRHDERQVTCQFVKEAAIERLERVIPIEICTSTTVDKAAMLQTSLRTFDTKVRSKITQKFAQLADWVAKELGLIKKSNKG